MSFKSKVKGALSKVVKFLAPILVDAVADEVQRRVGKPKGTHVKSVPK